MMSIFRRFWDALLLAAGYFFGRERADLEHQKKHHEAVVANEKKTKKALNEVNEFYDGMLGDSLNPRIVDISKLRKKD